MPKSSSPENTDNAVDEILVRLSQEFVESTLDLLDEMDKRVDTLDKGKGDIEDVRQYIQREVHNIKGQGSTFGFPLTGRVAHMLEDYLLNVSTLQSEHLADIRGYLDLMVNLINQREPLDETERTDLLNSLPTGKVRAFSGQQSRNVNVLLVMPSGLQRKLVSRELLSCGFRVMRAYDCIEAQSVALDIVPDVVFVNYDMTPFTGREMCHVFAAIEKLRSIKIILLTSYDAGDTHISGLPGNVSVVQKHTDFTETIGSILIDMGLFGAFKDQV
jgi:CheY-like chemotaxis protein/HPt (histidine-containing phosphotransfer) domain-containing protein